MKYDSVSDLHVDPDFNEKKLRYDRMKNVGSKAIVIAGDVANDPMLTVQELRRAAEWYEHVIFVDGNHEHYSNRDLYNDKGKRENDTRTYGISIRETVDWLHSTLSRYNNISYLHTQGYNKEDASVVIDDVAFVGANGWYDFEFIPEGADRQKSIDLWLTYNDVKCCNFGINQDTMSAYAAAQLAREQAATLKRHVEDYQNNDKVRKIVLVTHTVPVREALQWTVSKNIDPLSNGAYGNSAMAEVFAADKNERIVHSVFGHTHRSYDAIGENGVRFVCNPRGYGWERQGGAKKYKPVQLDTDDERGIMMSAFGTVEE